MVRPITAEPKTFTELVNFVKATPNALNPATSTLSEQYINTIKKGAQEAQLTTAQFEMVVDMTSCRIPFSGNMENDKKIAQSYMQQKKVLMQGYTGTKSIQQQPSAASNEEIETFIQELIDQEENKQNLENFANPEYIWRQRYTGETFGNFTSELKNKFPHENPAKLKVIFINKLEEQFPVIKELTRRDLMLEYMNLNMPNKQQESQ